MTETKKQEPRKPKDAELISGFTHAQWDFHDGGACGHKPGQYPEIEARLKKLLAKKEG